MSLLLPAYAVMNLKGGEEEEEEAI